MKDWEREATARAARQIAKEEDARIGLELRPWDPPEEPVHAGKTITIDSLGAAPEPKWRGPNRQVRAPRAEEGEHDWWLAGTKSDHEAPVTYFGWGCKKCGRRVVTETPSKDAPCLADQNFPDEGHLRRAGVDADCRQALVDAVHDL